MKKHIVYKLTNTQTGGVYIGVTNNLKRRLWEHKSRVMFYPKQTETLNYIKTFMNMEWNYLM